MKGILNDKVRLDTHKKDLMHQLNLCLTSRIKT